MPGEIYEGTNRVYLNVIGGKLKQTVSENTAGAKRRDYELKDGTKGHKFEIEYKSWKGIITAVETRETDFGKQLVVKFPDATLSVQNEKMARSLVGKLANVDFGAEVTLSPYDFEDDTGKRLTGFSVMQKGAKVEDYFFDKKKKKPIKGFPEPEKDAREKYSKDDWKMYFMQVKKFVFLFAEMELAKKAMEASEKRKAEAPKEETPTGETKNALTRDGEDEGAINIDDIPF